MTGDDAKTKWCPFARQVAVEGRNNNVANHTSFNRCSMEGGKHFIPSASRCISSDCMAWVWDISEGLDGKPCQGHCGLVTER